MFLNIPWRAKGDLGSAWAGGATRAPPQETAKHLHLGFLGERGGSRSAPVLRRPSVWVQLASPLPTAPGLQRLTPWVQTLLGSSGQ